MDVIIEVRDIQLRGSCIGGKCEITLRCVGLDFLLGLQLRENPHLMHFAQRIAHEIHDRLLVCDAGRHHQTVLRITNT